MKILLFIFLITQSQQVFFNQFIQNETYMDEYHLQEFNKSSDKTSIKSIISKKILIVIIACLSLVIIVTLLIVYSIKDQIKDFAIRMNICQRNPVIHQFHPEILLRSSIREQTSSYKQIHDRLPANTKSKPVNESEKRDRTNIHTFMNSLNKHQQDSIFNNQYSQSAANLSLYH